MVSQAILVQLKRTFKSPPEAILSEEAFVESCEITGAGYSDRTHDMWLEIAKNQAKPKGTPGKIPPPRIHLIHLNRYTSEMEGRPADMLDATFPQNYQRHVQSSVSQRTHAVSEAGTLLKGTGKNPKKEIPYLSQLYSLAAPLILKHYHDSPEPKEWPGLDHLKKRLFKNAYPELHPSCQGLLDNLLPALEEDDEQEPELSEEKPAASGIEEIHTTASSQTNALALPDAPNGTLVSQGMTQQAMLAVAAMFAEKQNPNMNVVFTTNYTGVNIENQHNEGNGGGDQPSKEDLLQAVKGAIKGELGKFQEGQVQRDEKLLETVRKQIPPKSAEAVKSNASGEDRKPSPRKDSKFSSARANLQGRFDEQAPHSPRAAGPNVASLPVSPTKKQRVSGRKVHFPRVETVVPGASPQASDEASRASSHRSAKPSKASDKQPAEEEPAPPAATTNDNHGNWLIGNDGSISSVNKSISGEEEDAEAPAIPMEVVVPSDGVPQDSDGIELPTPVAAGIDGGSEAASTQGSDAVPMEAQGPSDTPSSQGADGIGPPTPASMGIQDGGEVASTQGSDGIVPPTPAAMGIQDGGEVASTQGSDGIVPPTPAAMGIQGGSDAVSTPAPPPRRSFGGMLLSSALKVGSAFSGFVKEAGNHTLYDEDDVEEGEGTGTAQLEQVVGEEVIQEATEEGSVLGGSMGQDSEEASETGISEAAGDADVTPSNTTAESAGDNVGPPVVVQTLEKETEGDDVDTGGDNEEDAQQLVNASGEEEEEEAGGEFQGDGDMEVASDAAQDDGSAVEATTEDNFEGGSVDGDDDDAVQDNEEDVEQLVSASGEDAEEDDMEAASDVAQDDGSTGGDDYNDGDDDEEEEEEQGELENGGGDGADNDEDDEEEEAFWVADFLQEYGPHGGSVVGGIPFIDRQEIPIGSSTGKPCKTCSERFARSGRRCGVHRN